MGRHGLTAASAVGGRGGGMWRSSYQRTPRRLALVVVGLLSCVGLLVVSSMSPIWGFLHPIPDNDDLPTSTISPTSHGTSPMPRTPIDAGVPTSRNVDVAGGNKHANEDVLGIKVTPPHTASVYTTAPLIWHCTFPVPGGGETSLSTRVRSPPSRSFVPLTHFNFWGTTMNTSSPCPTSGLNNQLTMLIGLLHCSLGQRSNPAQAVPSSFLQKGAGISSGGTVDAVVGSPPSFVVVANGRLPPAKNGTATEGGRTAYISSNPLWDEGVSTASSCSSTSPNRDDNRHRQQQQPIAPAFFFKDITCSPTGGKEGGTSFKVGSADYEYAWFRWSEIFDVERGMRELGVAAAAVSSQIQPGVGPAGEDISTSSSSAVLPLPHMCLRDEFSWGEHAWMKKNCPTTVDHIYGTARYWWLRRALPLHDWYYVLVHTFLHTSLNPPTPQQHISKSTSSGGSDNGEGVIATTTSSTPSDSLVASSSPSPSSSLYTSSTTIRKSLREMGQGILAIHVRRGDYFNFCKNTAKTSGVKKFIIATHRWLRGAPTQVPNSTTTKRNNPASACSASSSKYLGIDAVNPLSSKFMDACVPTNDRIFRSIADVLQRHDEAAAERRRDGGGAGEEVPITTLLVATNSNAFLAATRQHFSTVANSNNNNVMGARGAHRSGIVRVLSFSEYYSTLKQQQANGDSSLSKILQQVSWPSRHGTDGATPSSTASSLTTTERSLVDVALLSVANTAILNKYSTFSQSAVDFRAVREGSLEGLRLYWW